MTLAQRRLLIYAINGTGMGHLNRTLVLARAARTHDPSAQILFAVASPMFGLIHNAGFPVLKVLDRSHNLGSQILCEARKTHLSALFRPLLEDFRPTTFMVDFTMDARLFDLARDSGAQVAAILRKPRPKVLWSLAVDPAARRVDRFLLPHPREEFRVRELPPNLRRRGRQLGPVVKTLNAEGVLRMQARYKKPGRPLIVAAVGGGGYEESRQTVSAVEHAAERAPHLDWVIVYGPYLSQSLIDASASNVTRLRFEPELLELYAAADAAVCNAGYNTIREMQTLSTPAAVIPVKGTGRDDQHERALDFAKAGSGLVCEPDGAQLLHSIESLLQRQRRPARPTESLAPLGKLLWDCLES